MTVSLDQSVAVPAADSDDALFVVDLGGTQLRTAVFTPNRVMLTRQSILTPRRGGSDAVIAAVVDQIQQAAVQTARPLRLVGVSALGPVDPVTGVIRSAPTLSDFTDVPLGQQLRAALGVPVHVYNDANSAAVAEWRLGAGRGTQHFCYITVSTGIGCGIITSGRLVTGHAGYAGELGRIRIPAPSGAAVRLEDISSGTAIAAEARAELQRGEPSNLRSHPDPDNLTAADVATAAQAGDPLAQRIFTAAIDTLGLQVANLTRLVTPEIIAIGGGVSFAGDIFWDPLRAAVEASLVRDSIPLPQLRPAQLGGDAGLHGTALALLEHTAPDT